jgi:hypothetical protein
MSEYFRVREEYEKCDKLNDLKDKIKKEENYGKNSS